MSHDKDDPDQPIADEHPDAERRAEKILYEQGATEEQTERIEAIVGSEVLGYDGSGRGEHSGQEGTAEAGGGSSLLADNRPDQIE